LRSISRGSRTILPRAPGALAIQANVTQSEARIAMLNAVAERFGRLDVLINNAGSLVERNFAVDADPTHDSNRKSLSILLRPYN